jgi:uncharacterized protein (TIGR02118 family)
MNVAKYFALLNPPEAIDALEYLVALKERCATAAAAGAVPNGLTLDTVDVPPAEAGLRPGGHPAYAAVLEFRAADDSTARRIASELAGNGASVEPYRVTEVVEKAGPPERRGARTTNGIKSIYLARRRADLTHEEMARHWAETHAPLALRHHIGMWRYVRNVVDAPLTPVNEPWDGFAELFFWTSEDLIERMFDSPAGQQTILADIAKFSGPGKALHTREHILLA